MKKISLFLITFLMALSAYAQSAKGTWYYYSIGGSRPESYEVQKVIVSDKAISDKCSTSPGSFDFDYVVTKVIEKGSETRFITKDDGGYNAFVIKNITAKAAKKEFITGKKTEAEAINAKVNDKDMSDLFTEEGFKEQELKPVLKSLTREEASEVIGGLEKGMENLKKDGKLKNEKDKAMAGFVLMLAVPKMWLEKKGYNAYKSLITFSKGLESFKDDPELKKRMDAIFGNNAKKEKK